MTEETRPEPSETRQKLPEKEKWPMWPIALAIACFVIFYTYIQLNFRKEGPAFEPAQARKDLDAKEYTQNTLYEWYSITPQSVEKPSIQDPSDLIKRTAIGGFKNRLPVKLEATIIEPRAISRVGVIEAPRSVAIDERYHISFEAPSAIVSDERFRFFAFYKQGDLHFIPQLLVEEVTEEHLKLMESEPTKISFSITRDLFQSEEVSATFHTADEYHTWTFAVEQAAAKEDS